MGRTEVSDMGIISTIVVLFILWALLLWRIRRDNMANDEEIEIIQMPKEPEVEPCGVHGCAGEKGD